MRAGPNFWGRTRNYLHSTMAQVRLVGLLLIEFEMAEKLTIDED